MYNTAGQLVADSGCHLYSGTLYNPIEYDQNGNLRGPTVSGLLADPYAVPTGANADGSISSPNGWWSLGSIDNGMGASFGYSNQTTQWLASGNGAIGPNSNPFPLYALSSPITAPTPEPSTLTLLGSALLGLGVVYLRRRGAKA